MGFFEKLKEAAIKAKCATGFHAGEWQAIDGKPICNMEKICPDCQKHLTKIDHAWEGSGVYEESGSCVKSRNCKHCDAKERRIVHDRYEKFGSKDDYCRFKERCVRCKHERVGGEAHSWHKLSTNADEDTVTYVCSSCDKKENRPRQRH